MQEELAIAMIYLTHDRQDPFALATRTVVIEEEDKIKAYLGRLRETREP
ncbi:hypothetical protein [Candidatus Scalindua japonica]|nr:hypothetical protein [Candidatus Scalindua japonica]